MLHSSLSSLIWMDIQYNVSVSRKIGQDRAAETTVHKTKRWINSLLKRVNQLGMFFSSRLHERWEMQTKRVSRYSMGICFFFDRIWSISCTCLAQMMMIRGRCCLLFSLISSPRYTQLCCWAGLMGMWWNWLNQDNVGSDRAMMSARWEMSREPVLMVFFLYCVILDKSYRTCSVVFANAIKNDVELFFRLLLLLLSSHNTRIESSLFFLPCRVFVLRKGRTWLELAGFSRRAMIRFYEFIRREFSQRFKTISTFFRRLIDFLYLFSPF